jgi:CheY-like chemotaxis protein
MKVLVVDDNIAIQEILKDILIDAGHIVKIAGTIDEAVDLILDFKPNAILLDSVVNDEDGLQILARAHERDHEAELDSVLVKGANEGAPRDNKFIKAVVNKPFKSSDISAALNILVAKREEENAQKAMNSKKRKPLLGLKKAKKEDKEQPASEDAAAIAEHVASEGPMFGRSYVFFEKSPKKVYDFTEIFDLDDYSLLVVSSDNSKAVKANLGKENLEVVTLSSSGRGKTMNINALGTLTVYIKQYILDHEKPIVLIDNFTEIIDSSGMNHAVLFLHQLVTWKAEGKMVSFMVSVDQSILTSKDRSILLGDMSEYSN